MEPLKYDYTIDRSRENYASNKILKYVPSGSKVLEVGCSTGYLSRVLRDEFNCQVTGIEIIADAAELARPFCEQVLVGDVETMDLPVLLGSRMFDVVIMADVLEHLQDPAKVLKKCCSVLKDDGLALVSIPNVGYKGVIYELFNGKFQSRSHGILDDSHRQYYGLNEAIELLSHGDMVLVELDRTVKGLEDSEFHTDIPDHLVELSQVIEDGVESSTYQFIIVASPVSEKGLQKSARFLARNISSLSKAERNHSREKHTLLDVISEKNRQIAHRDEVIREKNRLIAHRDEVIKEKNKLIAHRDEVIKKKNRLIAYRDEVINHKNHYLNLMRAKFEEFGERNRDLQNQLGEWKIVAKSSILYLPFLIYKWLKGRRR